MYTFYKNGKSFPRITNLEHAVDILFQTDEEGRIMLAQIITVAPTHREWTSIPNKAKINAQGNIIVNRHGYQEVDFVRKQEDKPVVINVVVKDEIQQLFNLLEFSNYVWEYSNAVLEEMTASETVKIEPIPMDDSAGNSNVKESFLEETSVEETSLEN